MKKATVLVWVLKTQDQNSNPNITFFGFIRINFFLNRFKLVKRHFYLKPKNVIFGFESGPKPK